MNIRKAFSHRALFWSIFFIGILCIIADLAFYVLLGEAFDSVYVLEQVYIQIPELKPLIQQIRHIDPDRLGMYFVSGSAGIFCIFALLLWASMRGTCQRLIERYGLDEKLKFQEKPAKKYADIKPVDDSKEKEESERRLFLHLLTVLQREGRLLDFFAENLNEYDDGQIGAAVRSIHENCQKVIHKYLTTEPVLKQDEGEEITVAPGFDPGCIKLTGNIAGEPPFKGIVRHKGWKSVKFEIPTLSGKDPNIIAPAEVEIL